VGAGAGVSGTTTLVRQPATREVALFNGLFHQVSVFDGTRYVPGATRVNLGPIGQFTYVDTFRPAGVLIDFHDSVGHFMRNRRGVEGSTLAQPRGEQQ
jgi:hypothetical protein